MELVKGTVEYIRVNVKDRLGTLTTLSGTSPKFDVYGPDGTEVVTQANATSVGMEAFCLVDTTALAYGAYKLFLNFQIAPEFPRIGPFNFKVIGAP
jgi:hypothetical protein